MISNDNVRDIVNWELPEVKEIGVCMDCQQVKELEDGRFCLDCLIELDNLIAENDSRNQDFLIELFSERIEDEN